MVETRKHLSIRIKSELYEYIHQQAKASEKSLSRMLEKILEAYLQEGDPSSSNTSIEPSENKISEAIFALTTQVERLTNSLKSEHKASTTEHKINTSSPDEKQLKSNDLQKKRTQPNTKASTKSEHKANTSGPAKKKRTQPSTKASTPKPTPKKRKRHHKEVQTMYKGELRYVSDVLEEIEWKGTRSERNMLLQRMRRRGISLEESLELWREKQK